MHWNGFSSVWTLIWLFSWTVWENVWSHSLHGSGLSHWWIQMCLSKLLDSENLWSHSWHGYGFSPMWILIWLQRRLDWENAWLHSLQGYGLSTVCPILLCILVTSWRDSVIETSMTVGQCVTEVVTITTYSIIKIQLVTVSGHLILMPVSNKYLTFRKHLFIHLSICLLIHQNKFTTNINY